MRDLADNYSLLNYFRYCRKYPNGSIDDGHAVSELPKEVLADYAVLSDYGSRYLASADIRSDWSLLVSF